MATAITMPRLGLSMVEGTVIEWRVRVGDPVRKGVIILNVESEKAEVEIEAFASGVVAAIYAEAGTTLTVGALLGAIAAEGERFDAGAFASAFVPEVAGVPATARRPGAPPPDAGVAPAVGAPGAGAKAAPAARALARRLGLDLAAVAGTGPGGRITVEDVERAASPLARVNGTALAFTRAGTGPGVLLIAGYGVDASGWRRQIEGLAADATVVSYDHRGVGASEPIAAPGLTLAELADDAHALLEHLALVPAVVVGASLGAAVALELALRHGPAVRGLVLVTPVLERDARFEAVLRGWCAYETPQDDARIAAMLPWLLGREWLAHPGRREAAAASLRAMAARTPVATLRAHAAALLGWLGTRGGDLRQIAAPALVVAGADDVLTPPAQAEAVARALDRPRLEVLAGAGHALMIERAEALNALVRTSLGLEESAMVDAGPQ